MFGNAKGWVISTLILVFVGLLIFYMGKPPQITPPTGKIPLALASAALKVDPASLGIVPAGTDADAHDLYVKVIDDYKTNQYTYEKYSDVNKLAKDKPGFLQWIVDAGDCNKAILFGRKPEQIVNYDNQLASIEALRTVGGWANTLGLYLVRQKNYDEATPYLKGGFILGQRLYAERLRWEEYQAGTDLMSNAAFAMAKEARDNHDDKRAGELESLLTAIKDYHTSVVPVWQAISGIGTEGEPLNNSGDMFDIAKNGKEPMWQVEAALKLGRMRFMNNVTASDQRGAARVLKDLAVTADALSVRTAAARGRDLTREEFRKIGGGS